MLGLHAYIEVADLEHGIEFYCRGFDLRLKRRLSPRWAELSGAQIPVFLLGGLPSLADLGSLKAERSYQRHWTPVHLDFIVANLDEAVARLEALGAVLDRPIKDREYGRIANLADPFGNGFDVIEFTRNGYDAVDRRE